MTPVTKEPTAGTLGGRTRVAATATVAVGRLSRMLRLGNGSVIGGRIGLAIQPEMVHGLSVGKRCALVSGTNGKTTTTRLLVAALGGPELVPRAPGQGRICLQGWLQHSPCLRRRSWRFSRLTRPISEVSRHATSPEVMVLLNLPRDQLDRVNEVRMLAQRWRKTLTGRTGLTVVANADDPLVTWAVSSKDGGPQVLFVAAGQLWHEDATGCPSCGGRITFHPDGGWSSACGFERPQLHASLTDAGLELEDGRVLPISLAMPARCNRANAAMAAVAASVFGEDEADALSAMSMVREVEGRFSQVHVDGVATRLLLAKNPAGWAELLDLLAGSDLPIVVGINSRIADGHDPSWLWDVPFEEVCGRELVATGERCLDLAVRFKYAGLEHRVERDQRNALVAVGAPAVDYVGNYTAFQQLRRSVGSDDGSLRRSNSPVPATTAHGLYGSRPVPVAGTSGGESALRIAVVHPDLLGTYGDGGNGRVLACHAAWRGWPVELILARSDKPLPTADIYCLGGGEDWPQAEAADLLRGSVLESTVSSGAALLAVCAGFQIVGRSFPDADGKDRDGLGLLDVVTVKNPGKRLVGEVVADPVSASLGSVDLALFTGFENHSGLTRLGPDVARPRQGAIRRRQWRRPGHRGCSRRKGCGHLPSRACARPQPRAR